jgi:lysophospholipase L1-like esterase
VSYYRFWPCIRIGSAGDSLGGQSLPGNWQYYLWQNLNQNTKLQVQFVGSANGPPPIWTNTYPGKRIDEIDLLITTEVIPENEPDILICMAGTNDALQGASAATMFTRTITLMTNLFTMQPGIRLIYAKPPPLSLAGAGVTQAKIDVLRDYAAGLSAQVNANFSRQLVSVVDCWTGFNPDTMLYDGIHQNGLGGRFIAGAMVGPGTGLIVEDFARSA